MNGQYNIGDLVFTDWTIKKRLGAGSFGKVYEIERDIFGETYRAALKVISVPQNETEFKNVLDEGMTVDETKEYFYSAVKQIAQEFALMTKVRGNSNIVSCEDYTIIEHESGCGWDILIRMEELIPLLTYASQHPFSRRDVIKLGIDISRALETCQKYNIIHRDIKPENIFVSENGDFKLGDFGIARTIEKTVSGMSKKGTYNYMAPEVYQGTEYGFSVDTYSLGIVLYRLLNRNRTPFLPPAPEPITYSSRDMALAKRMSGQPLPLPYYASGRLGEIVLKAAAYKPADRYSSPMQMRQELEAILYTENESAIIYPDGDEMAISNNEYVSSHSTSQGKSSAKINESVTDPAPLNGGGGNLPPASQQPNAQGGASGGGWQQNGRGGVSGGNWQQNGQGGASGSNWQQNGQGGASGGWQQNGQGGASGGSWQQNGQGGASGVGWQQNGQGGASGGSWQQNGRGGTSGGGWQQNGQGGASGGSQGSGGQNGTWQRNGASTGQELDKKKEGFPVAVVAALVITAIVLIVIAVVVAVRSNSGSSASRSSGSSSRKTTERETSARTTTAAEPMDEARAEQLCAAAFDGFLSDVYIGDRNFFDMTMREYGSFLDEYGFYFLNSDGVFQASYTEPDVEIPTVYASITLSDDGEWNTEINEDDARRGMIWVNESVARWNVNMVDNDLLLQNMNSAGPAPLGILFGDSRETVLEKLGISEVMGEWFDRNSQAYEEGSSVRQYIFDDGLTIYTTVEDDGQEGLLIINDDKGFMLSFYDFGDGVDALIDITMEW